MACVRLRAHTITVAIPCTTTSPGAATGIIRAAFARTFKLTPRQVANLEAGRANLTLATLARLGRPFG